MKDLSGLLIVHIDRKGEVLRPQESGNYSGYRMATATVLDGADALEGEQIRLTDDRGRQGLPAPLREGTNYLVVGPRQAGGYLMAFNGLPNRGAMQRGKAHAPNERFFASCLADKDVKVAQGRQPWSSFHQCIDRRLRRIVGNGRI